MSFCLNEYEVHDAVEDYGDDYGRQPTKPAADLDPGDRFLDPNTGLQYVFGYHRPAVSDDENLVVAAYLILRSGHPSARLQYLYLDPSAIVNVEAAR